MQRTAVKLLQTLVRQQNLGQYGSTATRAMSSSADYNFETLKVTQPTDFVYQVELNRPKKRNAMNMAFWREMVECFKKISTDPDCRAVVLSGAGKNFTAGLDLMESGFESESFDLEPARRASDIRDHVEALQEAFTMIEKCPKPVIAAIHSACVGGGVDMVTACDIRYCTQDAWFQVKEVDVGLAADVGTLQRLPKVVGNDSLVRELCYTARKLLSDEAKECGLVSRVFSDRDALIKGAVELATDIASKSPIAVQGTKVNLVYSRDHSVKEGLHYMAIWSQLMLQSEDLVKAATASMEKKTATFSKL